MQMDQKKDQFCLEKLLPIMHIKDEGNKRRKRIGDHEGNLPETQNKKSRQTKEEMKEGEGQHDLVELSPIKGERVFSSKLGGRASRIA